VTNWDCAVFLRVSVLPINLILIYCFFLSLQFTCPPLAPIDRSSQQHSRVEPFFRRDYLLDEFKALHKLLRLSFVVLMSSYHQSQAVTQRSR